MPLKIKTNTAAKPAAQVTQTQSTKGAVTAEHNEQVQVEDSPVIKPEEGMDPWCQVGFEASYTHNLGNYCSTRFAVSLTIPCPHAQIDKVYAFAEEWVNAKMEALTAELPDAGK